MAIFRVPSVSSSPSASTSSFAEQDFEDTEQQETPEGGPQAAETQGNASPLLTGSEDSDDWITCTSTASQTEPLPQAGDRPTPTADRPRSRQGSSTPTGERPVLRVITTSTPPTLAAQQPPSPAPSLSHSLSTIDDIPESTTMGDSPSERLQGPRLPRSLNARLQHPNLAPLVRSGGEQHLATLQNILDSTRLSTGPWQSQPERFVWNTFISLLRAVHFLHTGCRSRDDTPPPDWQPIIHNTITPSNIFYTSLRTSGATDGEGAKLGNYSRAVMLARVVEPEDMDANELEHRSQAFAHLIQCFDDQTSYDAPEILLQCFPKGSDSTCREHLDAIGNTPGPASDLWSIGAVMVEMMSGRSIWDFLLEKACQGDIDGTMPEYYTDLCPPDRLRLLRRYSGTATITRALPAHYAPSLRMLVEALLDEDPRDRGRAVDSLHDAEAMLRVRQLELEKRYRGW